MEKGKERVEEEDDEEPADDGNGDAVQEVRTATHSSLSIDCSCPSLVQVVRPR